MIEQLEPELSTGETTKPKAVSRRSLAERLEVAPGRYLSLFTVIYLFAEYCSNRHRAFWIDELFTYSLANLPSIKDIWPLIRQGIELNPPLPFWTTWVVHHSLGRGEFITRLPAILGFWGMCVCLFCYVRRRSDTTHGFIALLLPLFTYTAWDSTWARGYGMLLGFSAAAMLSWQFATDKVKRSIALPALGISLAGALSCHYYGLYSAGVIACAELVRTWNRKRIDLPIFVAVLAGVSPLMIYVPLLRAVSEGTKTFWITPMVRFLYESYADLFGPAAMVLLLFIICALRMPKGEQDWTATALPAHELAACLLFAAMPFVVFVASHIVRIASFSRYVQPVVIGFSIAVAMFLYRVGGKNRSFRNLAVSLTVWLCFAPWAFWHMLNFFLPAPWTTIQAGYHFPEKNLTLPIIIDNDDLYMVVFHYAPEGLRDHLFYLNDRESSIKYLGTDTGLHSLVVCQTFQDLHVVKYDDFVREYPVFLVSRPRPNGWVLQRLLNDGANIQLLDERKNVGTFVDDHMIFRVVVPAASKR
jgi:hypothetical protein